MQWFRRAVSILPGSPFFHLRALFSLPQDEQQAALQWLCSNLGQIQQQGLIHPQQFHRFNTLLDLLGANRQLRLYLIDLVHHPHRVNFVFSRFDGLLALLIHLAHPDQLLQPTVHRHFIQLCRAQSFHPERLLHWYRRFQIHYQSYATACDQLGLDLLADETRLRKALRKARSNAHPDHQGQAQQFHRLEQLKHMLAL